MNLFVTVAIKAFGPENAAKVPHDEGTKGTKKIDVRPGRIGVRKGWTTDD